MGYASDKKFSTYTDNIKLVIDGCGNSHEDKYYVNGMYIDLCGLPIKEYMSNPCCGGGSGTNPDVNTKCKNNIIVTSYEKDDYIYYKAVADYPVSSNIKIRVVNSETGSVTELEIYIGETESEEEIGESLKIENITLNIEEDDDFQYIPLINGEEPNPENKSYTVYISALHLDEINNLSSETINSLQSISINQGNTVKLQYIIPATDINYNDFKDEEFLEFCEKNQYGLILILSKELYDSSAYSIYNYSGVDMKNNFKLNKNYIINEKEFVCLIEKAVDDIFPYVPLFEEDLMYEYKLTLN